MDAANTGLRSGSQLWYPRYLVSLLLLHLIPRYLLLPSKRYSAAARFHQRQTQLFLSTHWRQLRRPHGVGKVSNLSFCSFCLICLFYLVVSWGVNFFIFYIKPSLEYCADSCYDRHSAIQRSFSALLKPPSSLCIIYFQYNHKAMSTVILIHCSYHLEAGQIKARA